LREEVRRSLDAGEVRSGDLVRLAEEVVSEVPGNEEEIAVSMIKDLVQVSRADESVLSSEEESVRKVAEAQFGERAGQVVELAGKTSSSRLTLTLRPILTDGISPLPTNS